jgi:hypothetical protein
VENYDTFDNKEGTKLEVDSEMDEEVLHLPTPNPLISESDPTSIYDS